MRTVLPVFRFVCAAAGVLAGAGCWAIAGLDDRPVASGPATDAGDAGAQSDSSVGESGVLPDADVVSEAGLRLCAIHTSSVICDDFDDADLDTRWTTVEQYAGGTVTRGAPARSAPNAVVFTAPTDNAPRARIQRSLSGAYTKLTCNFDIFYDLLPAGGFEIAHFDITGQGGGTPSLLTLTNDAIKTAAASSSVTPVAQGNWAHYEVTIQLSMATGLKASVSKNGGALSTVDLSGFPNPPDLTTLSFGLRFKPQGDMKFRMDDVYCDLTP